MIKILNLITFMFYIALPTASGQTIDGPSVKLVETIIESTSTQQPLHESVLIWFGKAFKNSREVITADTQPFIAGRYINTFIFGGTAPVDWNHSIEVDIKDHKVRIRIWLVDNNPANYFYNKKGEQRGLYANGLKKLTDDAKQLEKTLAEHLTKKSEDW